MPPVVLFPVLLLVTYFLTVASLEETEETGSRSMRKATTTGGGPTSVVSLGNTSVRERDFRSTALLSDVTSKSRYKSTNISGDDLIEEGVSFVAFNNDLVTNKNDTYTPIRTSAKFIWTSKMSNVGVPRTKRSSDLWIETDIDSSRRFVHMHAFIVRDENIPECGVTADKTTKTRYFMCSGVILNRKRVLTSASCINSAQIDEHHINAPLAVLIGALREKNYVIKVESYHIHPEYVPNPRLMSFTTNNLAMIRLACPIPANSVVIPRLPSNSYDDVGHVCCPNRCKLLTIVQTSKNHHIIREMVAKHLPPPIHDSNDINLSKLKAFPINVELVNMKRNNALPTNSLKRKPREPGIAPTPQYFTQDMANKVKAMNLKKK